MRYFVLFFITAFMFILMTVSAALAGTVKTVTEDRGDYYVVTTTRDREAYEGDKCVFVTVQLVEKKTGAVLASNSTRSCEGLEQ